MQVLSLQLFSFFLHCASSWISHKASHRCIECVQNRKYTFNWIECRTQQLSIRFCAHLSMSNSRKRNAICILNFVKSLNHHGCFCTLLFFCVFVCVFYSHVCVFEWMAMWKRPKCNTKYKMGNNKNQPAQNREYTIEETRVVQQKKKNCTSGSENLIFYTN